MKKPEQSKAPFTVVLVLFALTSLALAFTVDVSISDEAGVRTEFPNSVGDWKGYAVRFCQNADCRKDFLVKDLDNTEVCPDCSGQLREASIAEFKQLPGDTVLLKKKYIHPNGRSIYASLVLSGQDRASIHRPEACLTGQGNTVLARPFLAVAIPGREPLGVRVMAMQREYKQADGRILINPFYYAYWFVGKDRETPSHYARMYYMAADRLFRNVAHRWAYIALSGQRDLPDNGHCQEIEEFLNDFYPAVTLINEQPEDRS